MASRASSSSSAIRPGKTIFEHLEDPQAAAALPSLRSVLAELAALTEKSDVRLDEVSRLVQADQGMSMRVLRMSNSVYYAPTTPILNVQDAILYIGLGNFRGAVLSAKCVEKTCHIRQSVLDWKEFWIHAAGVGRITMELASHLKEADLPEESFYLMGLLHDIGKVVLAQLMPEEFNEIYARAAREKVCPDGLELEMLGINHGHLGSWYMQKQGISPVLSDAVRFHHSPNWEDQSHMQHALLVALANQLVRHFGIGQSGNHREMEEPFCSPEWKIYAERCGVAEEAETELQKLLAKRIGEIADLVRQVIS